uniref:Transposase Tc1-like domain-containing protein n=1 Tax=Paramormyrops kingsleyae TaxID=1676925 RepID=A0A3B3QR86_9TELE
MVPRAVRRKPGETDDYNDPLRKRSIGFYNGLRSDVARELGVSQSVISRLASRHRTTGRVHDRPRSGAPRVTDRDYDQYLRTYALRHRNATATQLQARLRDARGTRVTPLTPRHRRERLQWAQDHVTWTMRRRVERIASGQHHEASEDHETSLSSCHCGKWWKHPLLTLSIFDIWGKCVSSLRKPDC